MMKKVLIISASSRKQGNSDILCDYFAKGARESGHQVEKVFLAEKNINFCSGCGVCNETHLCVQKDDMKEILDSMVAADVIVLATPVYFYSMNGRMKNFIDRTVPRYTEITKKDFYFIMTAADTDKENLARTLEGFRGFTQDCLEEAREAGIIYGTGAWQKGEIEESPACKEAYEMGRAL
ncbi:flavodoxin family protein [Anaerotignum lactatifermentans]|uniref:Flavodoxin family protein n=1 Tax=Anaerotignum lactatifermentans TaxID=160404 RepID=A0ABS2GDN1_9FIRM|nr:flavodoxin family protein [Anaerotignum lactatifermentans]MBM6830261.1 flavodoxin family protein [Anaerotignum lactatifermentans]MBM6878815.1 flavodoxin family protein [Anaerotignum lactatifermentans]MBM6951874.1 flavodoxin family protein [Anaerotignum lactatifermentans]